MKNILLTLVALIAIVGSVWGVDTYNKSQFYAMNSGEKLSNTFNAYLKDKTLDRTLSEIWELEHSGLTLTRDDELLLEKLIIKKKRLVKELEALGVEVVK